MTLDARRQMFGLALAMTRAWRHSVLAAAVAVFAASAAHPAVLSPSQHQALKPADVFHECTNCPEMVVVPAGSFTMGSPAGEPDHSEREAPQHVVTFTRPFAVGKYQVTVGEFAAFVQEAGQPPGAATCQNFAPYLPDPEPAVPDGPVEVSWRAMGYKQTDRFPVGCISWNDAQAYVTWLAKKTGHPYRLLSEAEFEYATRGKMAPGTYPPYFFGSDAADICKYGNGADTALAAAMRRESQDPKTQGPDPMLSCNDGHAFAAPVGSFQPNAFGLYDMQGNITQWLADCLHEDYANAPSDGSAWMAQECESHMMRGASWDSTASAFRSAMRMWASTSQNNPQLGFRVARTLD